MAEMTGRGYAGTEAAFGLYRGDELLGVGTAAELAERFGVHDLDGEMSDVYYRRVERDEQVEVKELES